MKSQYISVCCDPSVQQKIYLFNDETDHKDHKDHQDQKGSHIHIIVDGILNENLSEDDLNTMWGDLRTNLMKMLLVTNVLNSESSRHCGFPCIEFSQLKWVLKSESSSEQTLEFYNVANNQLVFSALVVPNGVLNQFIVKVLLRAQ